MAASDSSDSSLAPTSFTARTLNRYVELVVKPVTVTNMLVPVFATSVQSLSQELPVFFLYCHLVIGDPLFDVVDDETTTCW